MSTKVMLEIARHSTAKGNAKLVLLLLASYAHPDGTHAEMSLSTIAREAGLSRRQVNTIVHFLADTGHVLLESGAGMYGTNRYAVQRPWLSQRKNCPSAITAPVGQPLPTIEKESKDLKEQSGEEIALGQPLHQPPAVTHAAANWLRTIAQDLTPDFALILQGTPSQDALPSEASPRAHRGAGIYRLGKLCKRGHEHERTGQSLRRLPSGSCLQCDLERQEAKRQAQVQARREAKPARHIIDLAAHRQKQG
jgi:hypothetical protein